MELCISNNTNCLRLETSICMLHHIKTQKHEYMEYKINKQISTPQTHQLKFQTFKQFPNDLNFLYAMHNICEL